MHFLWLILLVIFFSDIVGDIVGDIDLVILLVIFFSTCASYITHK